MEEQYVAPSRVPPIVLVGAVLLVLFGSVKVGADLSLPLRIAHTFRVDNPENLSKRAGEIFARNLEALSGRHALAATPSAWRSEIASWRAATLRGTTP